MSGKESHGLRLDSELIINTGIEPPFDPEEHLDPDMELKHKVLDYDMSSFILESARDVKNEVLKIEQEKGTWRKSILKGILVLFTINVLALVALAALGALMFPMLLCYRC